MNTTFQRQLTSATSNERGRIAGRHFLQIPGPTNVPDRILQAISQSTTDHRSPAFGELGQQAIQSLKWLLQCSGPVVIYPASGTGAWEAALVNCLSPGDAVLMFETGHFANLWRAMAVRLGLKPIMLDGDWRKGIDPSRIAERLRQDTTGNIKAVAIVHNETSTGCAARIDEVRRAMNDAGH